MPFDKFILRIQCLQTKQKTVKQITIEPIHFLKTAKCSLNTFMAKQYMKTTQLTYLVEVHMQYTHMDSLHNTQVRHVHHLLGYILYCTCCTLKRWRETELPVIAII